MPNLKVIRYSEFKITLIKSYFVKHDHVTLDWSTHLITSVFYKNINFFTKDFLIKDISSK